MADLNFPSSPLLNETYTFNGKTWQWTGSYWAIQASGAINGVGIGNVVPSTGNFTTLTAEDIVAKSGILGTGNLNILSYTVPAGTTVFSPNNYQINTGVGIGLSDGTTQQIYNQLPSIIGSAGISVTGGSDNKLTITNTFANLGIANTAVNSTQYPVFGPASGNLTTANISTSQLSFNPATGTLTVGNVTINNPLPVSSGGTGNANLAVNSLLVGNGLRPVQQIAPGQAGNVLVSNGVGWTSSITIGYGLTTAVSRSVILP